ncbi:MAG: primosomal protein N' [Bacteroidetes bacterium RIFOXYA12_FULL_35_11]|nr:MAG: primosomal protein N' [Bacteroidetes bacterium GWF2_35_48]OFY79226.1 MAG: primosomal protein N' [Bacteroidetes bacterium RIFOXYA12_FULL_35_11]OFY96413.1 MAG: primosomal protein N' [Bacteroidetes bacterium RIFOXYB2_FULL_35_7]HBX51103.1 primosomal protein N' [Bacteroidales bacterium]
MFADIILPFATPMLYTYAVPEDMQGAITEGTRVLVQFGKKKIYSAIVYKLHEKFSSAHEIKSILSFYDDASAISKKQLELWQWIASYYMCSLGEVFNAAVPSVFKLESETSVFLNPDFDEDVVTTDYEEMIVQALQKKQAMTMNEVDELISKRSFSVINKMIENKVVFPEEKLAEKYKPRYQQYIALAENFNTEETLQAAFESLKRAPAQIKALELILSLIEENKNSDILKPPTEVFPGFSTALSALTKKEILVINKKEISRLDEEISAEKDISVLNSYQNEALKKIKALFAEKDIVLLHGITASGKTEVYIHLIQEYLNQGKQALYLLPEIAITSQIITRLRNVFGDRVCVYHSKFSDAEKYEIWTAVSGKNIHKKYDIVVGTRSAVFLPFSDLGCIIADEEHDASYKQTEPAPRYNARDTAIILARQNNAKVLLGSATPSVETYYNAISSKYGLVELSERFHDVMTPQILISDLRSARAKKTMQSHFSPMLMNAIRETLDEKGQVILFQNRRGFSPYLQCDACGWIPSCKKCAVMLTYHKYKTALVCHYCGYTVSIPKTCASCGSTEVLTKGFGTEKVEDEIAILFPEARLARMDMDTMTSRKKYIKVLTAFESGKIDILIGTQMITKGLDFENVRVVGILNADNMLHFPDFRSGERAFQLMAQVAGRAGRKGNRGKVIVQTSDPKHPVIVDFYHNEYINYIHKEIAERKEFLYPPFCRLIKIMLKHRDNNVVTSAALAMMTELNKIKDLHILGPENPVINKIEYFFLRNILIKLPKNNLNQEYKNKIQSVIQNIKANTNYKNLIVLCDVDMA